MTFNVNGRFDGDKRQQTFQMLENKNTHITLLQETHSNPTITKKWEKEWSRTWYWHSGLKSKSSGVTILFKKGIDIEALNKIKDEEGKILSLSFLYEKQIFQITNTDSPTNPSLRKKFYKNLSQHLNKTNNQNLILTGDLNMVEDIYLDRQGGTPSNSHLLGLIHLQKIKQKYNLKDTWRKKKHTKRSFTYHNYNLHYTQ